MAFLGHQRPTQSLTRPLHVDAAGSRHPLPEIPAKWPWDRQTLPQETQQACATSQIGRVLFMENEALAEYYPFFPGRYMSFKAEGKKKKRIDLKMSVPWRTVPPICLACSKLEEQLRQRRQWSINGTDSVRLVLKTSSVQWICTPELLAGKQTERNMTYSQSSSINGSNTRKLFVALERWTERFGLTWSLGHSICEQTVPTQLSPSPAELLKMHKGTSTVSQCVWRLEMKVSLRPLACRRWEGVREGEIIISNLFSADLTILRH